MANQTNEMTARGLKVVRTSSDNSSEATQHPTLKAFMSAKEARIHNEKMRRCLVEPKAFDLIKPCMSDTSMEAANVQHN